jgi:PBSX family phage terminase large subunit
MAVVSLNNCFPEGSDGSRKPLPKQAEFLRLALDKSPASPKYIAYVGGIGSGKTLIGCITVLAWAVQYPGDYLVGRQFMPELKVTTLKTFLEICPPELIEEYRVADSLVKIKAVGGKISNIFFRQLEEADKLRSMNLSGFMLDECNQVSEEAFMLLQGRLRGGGIRKGILVSNPSGHDWLYRWFYQKDHFKNDWAKLQYSLIRAPSTENVHLPEGYLETLQQSWSEDRIKREIEGSFDAFEGMVYEEFRRDVHVIKPFRIPENWPRHIRIDHGYRNPTAVGFYAIGPDGEVYKYREFYQKEHLIHEIIKGNKREGKTGIIQLSEPGEVFHSAKIDPSTKNRRGTSGESDYDEYRRHWPDTWPVLGFAKNDVQVGIDRVKSYLKIHPKSGKPLLYIFDTCKNTIEEITQYRWQQLKPNQTGQKSEKEAPVKVDDHAMDEMRYMIVDLPEPYINVEDKHKFKYGTLERMLSDDLKRMKAPKTKGDGFGF